MASLSDILTSVQNGVSAVNNLLVVLKAALLNIFGQLTGLTATRINFITKQVITSTGTYTPTAGMVFCIIELVGSGAGGGGTAGTVGAVFSAGGGGGGSYARLVASAATIGAFQAVTIGNPGAGGVAGNNNGQAGNDVSVGALCIGKGGSPGSGSAAGVFGIGGAGGVAGTGDLTIPGGAGGTNLAATIATVFSLGGAGGISYFGVGGIMATNPNGASVAGTAGSNYGSGGGGALSHNIATSAAGGAGAKGIVFITEFCVA